MTDLGAMRYIEVIGDEQRLYGYEFGREQFSYSISTGKKGFGQIQNSEQTPLGRHEIVARIGQSLPVNTVFVNRQPTGEIFEPDFLTRYPNRDWILTRILWLRGLEPGNNLFGQKDSFRRYIYIHGTPDQVELGQPGSRGCIRMANQDLLALFDWVKIGVNVTILSSSLVKGK